MGKNPKGAQGGGWEDQRRSVKEMKKTKERERERAVDYQGTYPHDVYVQNGETTNVISLFPSLCQLSPISPVSITLFFSSDCMFLFVFAVPPSPTFLCVQSNLHFFVA